MNFLAHYLLATEYLTPALPLPAYAVGTALPDLLPLTASRARLRAHRLADAPAETALDQALLTGVAAHLATDGAFHKTSAFAEAQGEVWMLITQTGSDGMRVRRPFLAHVLVEMALDAALLRADRSLADRFYAAFAGASFEAVTSWTERTLAAALPALPGVLSRFGTHRYLYHYATDAGVAEGVNRLCARARQDTFGGPNEGRLLELVSAAVRAVTARADALVSETANALNARQ